MHKIYTFGLSEKGELEINRNSHPIIALDISASEQMTGDEMWNTLQELADAFRADLDDYDKYSH